MYPKLLSILSKEAVPVFLFLELTQNTKGNPDRAHFPSWSKNRFQAYSLEIEMSKALCFALFSKVLQYVFGKSPQPFQLG